MTAWTCSFFVPFCTALEKGTCNLFISCKLKAIQKNGRKGVGYRPIADKDLRKIWSHFDRKNNMVLQDEVAFTLYYFCGRGGELLYGLKPDSIIFEKDADGKEYATLSHLVVQKK